MIAVLIYVLWCHLAIDFGLLSTTLDMKVLQNAVSMRLGIRACWRWGPSPWPA